MGDVPTAGGEVPEPVASAADVALVEALRRGDEGAFRMLVSRHQRAMVGLASSFVPSRAVAEDVVQETWLAVLEGLDRFEGRSSLKTWIFRILVNRARTRGTRERRSVPMSSLGPGGDDDDGGERAVDPDRFVGPGHRWAGHWASPPSAWPDVPAEELLGAETIAVVDETVRELPVNQRDVITLRDIHGWSSEEVRSLLGITEVNQRVLLHRARSKVRAALAERLGERI